MNWNVKRTKINKKRGRDLPILKKYFGQWQWDGW